MKLLSIARDLQRRKSRDRLKMSVVEGVRAVEELLMSEIVIVGVLISSGVARTERNDDLIRELEKRGQNVGFPVIEVTPAEFESAASTDSPQGFLAVVRTPEHSFASVAGSTSGFSVPRILVLDAVQDPGNVGTIIRTAKALGVVATVALPGTVDLWNPKVVRSAMGALFRHVAFHASVQELQDYLKQSNGKMLVADMDGEPVELVAQRYFGAGESAIDAGNARESMSEGNPSSHSPVAIVMGNEGAGVSADIEEFADVKVSLRIDGMESLNVAIAAGILLYVLQNTAEPIHASERGE